VWFVWLVKYVNAPIDVVGAGVKVASRTALKSWRSEPAEEICPGTGTAKSSWMLSSRNVVSEKPAKASKTSVQRAAATWASVESELFMISSEDAERSGRERGVGGNSKGGD
jgi:hypothetical protein